MRAISFRTDDGLVKALCVEPGPRSQVASIKTLTIEGPSVFDTIGDDLFIILDADLVGTNLLMVKQHGGFTLPEHAGTAQQLAESSLKDRAILEAILGKAGTIWNGDLDGGRLRTGHVRR